MNVRARIAFAAAAFALVAVVSERLDPAIADARANGVTPPWSAAG